MNPTKARTARSRLLAVPALLALAAPLPALAQSYVFSQTFGSYSSIAGSGTPVTMSSTDDGYGSFTLPFTFSFFGQPVTTAYVTTNGLICFGNPSTSYSPTILPTPGDPDGFIAGFWDDMSVPAGAGVYYAVSGATGRRILTIEWLNLTPLSTTDSINIQVRLYEQSGNIEILYGSIVGTGQAGGVGVEDFTGSLGFGPTCGVSGACSFSSLSSGTMFVFTASNMPPMLPDLAVTNTSPLPSSVQPGSSYSVDVTVQNLGGNTAGSAEVQILTEVFGSPTVVGEGFVSSLSAGQSTTTLVTFTMPSGLADGTYPITVYVDPFDGVHEANESNNVYTAGSVVVGGGGSSIVITTTSLPPGTVGTTYSTQLLQSGATSPFWSVVSGSLPSGLQLSSSGRITGAPTTTGVFSFAVRCEQSGLTPGTRSFDLEITSATGFRISSTVLPQATVGQAYSGRIEATGGQAPYAYQIVSGKPSWLTMAADGSLSGTPDAAGMHELHVSVFDSATMFVEGVVTLEVVQGGPLTLVTTPADVVPGVVNLPYSVLLRASGGMQPYTFSINGNLPAGLALNGDTISGVPSAAGDFSFEIRVADAAGGSASGQFSIEITERTALTLDVPDTITVRPNTATDVELRATGGVPPYTWSIVGGGLPLGLALDGGHIRGTSTATKASAQVTLLVTDTQGESATKTVLVEVKKATSNNSGGGRGTTRDSGCGVMGAGEGPAPMALWALLVLGGVALTRRRPFLGAASVVDEAACPTPSSPGEPRSSRR